MIKQIETFLMNLPQTELRVNWKPRYINKNKTKIRIKIVFIV